MVRLYRTAGIIGKIGLMLSLKLMVKSSIKKAPIKTHVGFVMVAQMEIACQKLWVSNGYHINYC